MPETPVALSEDGNHALRRALSIVGVSSGRDEHDFYPTPPEAVEALLSVEKFDGDIWEPACGDGAICRVLERHGHDVMATDLIDRGYGEGGHDFLTSPLRAANVITNPPFRLAQRFIEAALERTTGKVAMLCKLAILEGAGRRAMFERSPLETVHVFARRLTLKRRGEGMKNNGMLPYCWLVFRHGHVGSPVVRWL